MKTGYLYRHIRLDTNKVFYIGIGGFRDVEKEFSYKRAYHKKGRNNLWTKISNKTDYMVEIILENLTFDEAQLKEQEFIKLYGRINNETGTLCNLTDGGGGSRGYIMPQESKVKISNAHKGKKKHWEVTDETKMKISKALQGNKNGLGSKRNSGKKDTLETIIKKRESATKAWLKRKNKI